MCCVTALFSPAVVVRAAAGLGVRRQSWIRFSCAEAHVVERCTGFHDRAGYPWVVVKNLVFLHASKPTLQQPNKSLHHRPHGVVGSVVTPGKCGDCWPARHRSHEPWLQWLLTVYCIKNCKSTLGYVNHILRFKQILLIPFDPLFVTHDKQFQQAGGMRSALALYLPNHTLANSLFK